MENIVTSQLSNQSEHSAKHHRAGKFVVLWIVQVLLALIFLFAGSMKLIMPIEMMTAQMSLPLPGLFLRFIGVAEVAGALGLLLPGLLRIQRVLTPLAAVGLVIIMIGATSITLLSGGGATALMPLVVGLFAASVIYGRRSWFAVA